MARHGLYPNLQGVYSDSPIEVCQYLPSMCCGIKEGIARQLALQPDLVEKLLLASILLKPCSLIMVTAASPICHMLLITSKEDQEELHFVFSMNVISVTICLSIRRVLLSHQLVLISAISSRMLYFFHFTILVWNGETF